MNLIDSVSGAVHLTGNFDPLLAMYVSQSITRLNPKSVILIVYSSCPFGCTKRFLQAFDINTISKQAYQDLDEEYFQREDAPFR